jgi:hypothetical protein
LGGSRGVNASVAARAEPLYPSPLMPQSKRDARLLDLARRGAEARIRELAQESSHLFELFPDLRNSFDADQLTVPLLIAGRVTRTEAAERPAYKRRGWGAAANARKAVRLQYGPDAPLSVYAASLDPKRLRKRTWTDAQRRAVAKGMKAYWAKRKKVAKRRKRSGGINEYR